MTGGPGIRPSQRSLALGLRSTSSVAHSTTSARAPSAGHYRVDRQRSTVRVTARHVFGLGGVSGTIKMREAELVVGDPATTTSLSAVLDATSFDTGSPKRDAEVSSANHLDTATYPDIAFSCHGMVHPNGQWVAAGTVRVAGVIAPVHVTLENFGHSAGHLTLRASARVDRYAQHIMAGKGMAGLWITLDISAVATREAQ